MSILCIDFETKDWGFAEDVGSGWPWGAVDILGMSYSELINDSWTEPKYITDVAEIKEVLSKASTIVAHNATYEAGIMKMLGFDMKKVDFLCTQIGAKLYDNLLEQTGLDYLGQLYFKQKKSSQELIDIGIDLGVVQPNSSYFSKAHDSKLYKAARAKAKKEAMSNLDRIQAASDIVGSYCNQDTLITCKLYDMFILADMPWKRFSKLVNVVTDVRARGVRVDLRKASEGRNKIHRKLIEAEREFWNEVGYMNYKSPKQVEEWAKSLGLPPALDLKGKPGYGKFWIKQYEHVKEVQLFAECKLWSKALEFAEAIFKFEKNGRVYPELKILEARTGRFACSKPNFQQIPSRDPDIAKTLREAFIPDEGEKFIEIDYSTQEPRIALHLGALLSRCSVEIEYTEYNEQTRQYVAKKTQMNAADVARQLNIWINNPKEDAYNPTVEMLNQRGIDINRKQVKAVLLGLMYGKGTALLARELDVYEDEAETIKQHILSALPYVFKLDKYCKMRFNKKSKQRYLTSIGGRKLLPEEGEEYKALNKLIQGSATDQTAEALIMAWENDIKIIGAIHDAIAATGTEADAERLKGYMENALKLVVPTVAEISIGNNWAECKE